MADQIRPLWITCLYGQQRWTFQSVLWIIVRVELPVRENTCSAIGVVCLYRVSNVRMWDKCEKVVTLDCKLPAYKVHTCSRPYRWVGRLRPRKRMRIIAACLMVDSIRSDSVYCDICCVQLTNTPMSLSHNTWYDSKRGLSTGIADSKRGLSTGIADSMSQELQIHVS